MYKSIISNDHWEPVTARED